MPKQYDEQTRAKAVRLVQEHRGDYASEYEAIKAIAGRLVLYQCTQSAVIISRSLSRSQRAAAERRVGPDAFVLVEPDRGLG